MPEYEFRYYGTYVDTYTVNAPTVEEAQKFLDAYLRESVKKQPDFSEIGASVYQEERSMMKPDDLVITNLDTMEEEELS